MDRRHGAKIERRLEDFNPSQLQKKKKEKDISGNSKPNSMIGTCERGVGGGRGKGRSKSQK